MPASASSHREGPRAQAQAAGAAARAWVGVGGRRGHRQACCCASPRKGRRTLSPQPPRARRAGHNAEGQLRRQAEPPDAHGHAQSLARSLALALTAVAWLQPPPVLPTPSANGPEGPPRPYGAEPPPGRLAAADEPGFVARPEPRAALRTLPPRRADARHLRRDADHEPRRDRARTGAERASAPPVRAWCASRSNGATSSAPIRPPDFDASDPASPAYDFTAVDAAVRETVAAGLTPLLVVLRAPAFAEAPHRWPYAYPGSWAPNPAAFGEFATAVARRYDGSFPDPLAARRRAAARAAAARRGTSPTSRAISSRSGSPRAGTGAPSRRCSTASCSTPSTPPSRRSSPATS